MLIGIIDKRVPDGLENKCSRHRDVIAATPLRISSSIDCDTVTHHDPRRHVACSCRASVPPVRQSSFCQLRRESSDCHALSLAARSQESHQGVATGPATVRGEWLRGLVWPR